jgi:peptidyl-Lys metalloendopeptidase
VVAGTDDNVYGQPACRQLARDSPEEAIANADRREYFAENTPSM